MINRFSVFSLLISYLLACSPVPGWQPATIQQQVNHSGAIIFGRVSNVFQNAGDRDVIRLTSSIFFKGCGPDINDVDGFTSSAECGLDHPQVGDWVVVFVCRDGNRWRINHINLHTGMVPFSNLTDVITLTGGPSCTCQQGLNYGACTKPLVLNIPPILRAPDVVDRPARPPRHWVRRGFARRP